MHNQVMVDDQVFVNFSSRRKVEAFIASHPADGGAYDWGIWYMNDPMRDPDISLYA